MDYQRLESERKGPQAMAKSGMTLANLMATTPDIDLARIDAATPEDIRRHMRDEGYDPNEATAPDDIISPAFIRKRLGMTQQRFADAIHVPVAKLQNWEQGRTVMDPSARALMTIIAREPEAALRALRVDHVA
jgi:putative transcriptional regulator